MIKTKTLETETTQLLLRIPISLKAALQEHADAQGRKLTQEINIRLRNSLPAHGPTMQRFLAKTLNLAAAGDDTTDTPGIAPGALPPSYTAGPTPGLTANDNGPAPALSSLDRAMLDVFHAMPVEKQLALLSLFKQ